MNNADQIKDVKKLVHSNLYEKGYVCAVNIFLQLDYLSQKDNNEVNKIT